MSDSSIWSWCGSTMPAISGDTTACILCSAAIVRTTSPRSVSLGHERVFWLCSWDMPPLEPSNGVARARIVI